MNMRDTLSGPMLGQLAASGTLICFIGYQATTTLDDIAKCLMSCLFLGYNLFDFYIICRWCEEITNQSAKVGEAIYCSGWECGLSKLPGVRSTILFVIARANRPLVLTAGGMYDLSLTSYTTNTLPQGSFFLLEEAELELERSNDCILTVVTPETFSLFDHLFCEQCTHSPSHWTKTSSCVMRKLVKTSYSALTVLLRFRHD